MSKLINIITTLADSLTLDDAKNIIASLTAHPIFDDFDIYVTRSPDDELWSLKAAHKSLRAHFLQYPEFFLIEELKKEVEDIDS